jgi:hypothetical protein
LRYNGRVYIPDSESAVCQEIIKIHYNDPQGDHYAVKRTLEAVKRKY